MVYGNPETTTGGNALKFYCSVRLDIRRKKPIKRGEETIGSECKVKVVKNKLAPPFREADFEILYGIGVNKLGELVDTAEKLGAATSGPPAGRPRAAASSARKPRPRATRLRAGSRRRRSRADRRSPPRSAAGR